MGFYREISRCVGNRLSLLMKLETLDVVNVVNVGIGDDVSRQPFVRGKIFVVVEVNFFFSSES